MADLPQNWQSDFITKICKIYQPKTIATSQLISGGEYPVFGANGQIGFYDKYNHEEQEVLITCRGATCGNINKSKEKSWINGNAMVASPLDQNILDKDFLFFFLNSISFKDYITGSAQPQITRTSLEKLLVLLPPLNEQKRIVKKLDSIMPKIDEVNERLEKIPLILKRARQSILNQAITGELTKDWRKEHLGLSDTSSLWNKRQMADIGRILCGVSPKTSETNMNELGEPYVSGPEQWNGRNIIINKWTEYSNRIAPANSIFITVKGAGVGKVFPGIEAAIGRDIYAFIPNDSVSYYYILIYLQNITSTIIEKAQGLIPGLSKEHIMGNDILLPSLEEQEEIVKQVKKAFEKLDKIEEQYKKAKSYTDKLTQSILHKAFKGDLVPQDPNDKPVELSE